MGTEQNYYRSEPAVLGMNSSPFSARMGEGANPHSTRSENGDENRTEATPVPATAVVDRPRSSVSHPTGLEASPTRRPPTPRAPTLGSAALGDGMPGHDLGRRRFSSREVRDAHGLCAPLIRPANVPAGPRRGSRRHLHASPCALGRWPPGCAPRSDSASPSGCSSTASSRWAAMVPGSSVHAPRSWRPPPTGRQR